MHRLADDRTMVECRLLKSVVPTFPGCVQVTFWWHETGSPLEQELLPCGWPLPIFSCHRRILEGLLNFVVRVTPICGSLSLSCSPTCWTPAVGCVAVHEDTR